MGHSIDLQVWRGKTINMTHAEGMTERAIFLSQSLSSGTTEVHRQHVAMIHEFASCSSWKGHRLCRMSGIALTCLAIVIGRGDAHLTTMKLLKRVRDVISQDSPIVDFDRLDYHDQSIGRPSSALTVIVNEINIATRLTVATTRNLVDTLAFTMDRGVILSQEDYNAWRRRNMITCLSIRPRDASKTIALTLYSSVSRLDGHPLVDTAFVGERPCGTIDIYVTVSCAPSPERYGFRDSDMIEKCHHDTSVPQVMVHRNGRCWTLCAKWIHDHAGSTVEMTSRTSTSQMIHLPHTSLCVPNAPHLQMDVGACFDAKHWTIV
jgi:hypothetical protein